MVIDAMGTEWLTFGGEYDKEQGKRRPGIRGEGGLGTWPRFGINRRGSEVRIGA